MSIICEEHVKIIVQKYQKYAKTTQWVCQKYVKKMSNRCLKDVNYMSKKKETCEKLKFV